MDRLDALVSVYRSQLAMPWKQGLAGPERVWIAVYPPDLERRLRIRIPEFEIATKEAQCHWRHLDVTTSFAEWLASQEYREAYFEDPEAIKPALQGYAAVLQERIHAALTADDVGADTVVALTGVGSVFPMVRVSDVIQRSATAIRGRLLVFFPGAYEHGNYRLLDARDGWNYLAIPITIPEGAS